MIDYSSVWGYVGSTRTPLTSVKPKIGSKEIPLSIIVAGFCLSVAI